ncbi:hypothetical protein BJ741DRAFT_614695 [Chytriomyces cf. hyalinus JEL632]|nr:hypothetical protein BJ741DRAFT_614695 [Chytriomyces cf. hyalinus JEL632]
MGRTPRRSKQATLLTKESPLLRYFRGSRPESLFDVKRPVPYTRTTSKEAKKAEFCSSAVGSNGLKRLDVSSSRATAKSMDVASRTGSFAGAREAGILCIADWGKTGTATNRVSFNPRTENDAECKEDSMAEECHLLQIPNSASKEPLSTLLKSLSDLRLKHL